MARAVGGIDSERDIFDGARFRMRKGATSLASISSVHFKLLTVAPLFHELIPGGTVVEWSANYTCNLYTTRN